MLKGKKTAIFALILVMLGAAEGFEWVSMFDDPVTAGWIVSGIGAIAMVLRAFTTTPILKDE